MSVTEKETPTSLKLNAADIEGIDIDVEEDLGAAFRRQKDACRERLGWNELTHAEFLQILLDVHALHLDLGGDRS